MFCLGETTTQMIKWDVAELDPEEFPPCRADTDCGDKSRLRLLESTCHVSVYVYSNIWSTCTVFNKQASTVICLQKLIDTLMKKILSIRYFQTNSKFWYLGLFIRFFLIFSLENNKMFQG